MNYFWAIPSALSGALLVNAGITFDQLQYWPMMLCTCIPCGILMVRG